MALTAAQLLVKVSADTTAAEAGLKSVGEKAQESSGMLHGLLGNIVGFAAGGVIAQGVGTAFGFLKDQLGDAVQQGMEGNQVWAQLEAGLRSTHDASGMTLQSLDALSNSILNQTGIDDDSTKAAES